ncbi:zinc finger protein 862-like [Mercenaria mercenaria]|uniref:zinc finger protein 862-like n=1 Tax=Mercenaria mercenaria TaxID=6596 RepID=UPI001E1D25D8|nr:zinc finger protein 862-like [Mercenaria mercenaria]XP_045193149.1 zinc finger protein 862-like [Mercenaria mercenaria]
MSDLVDQPFKFHPPTDRETEHFMKNVYNPFFDSIVQNLEKRLPNIAELEAFSVFSPQLWPEDSEEFAGYGKDEIQMLSVRFQSSLNCQADVQSEFQLLKNTVRNDQKLVQEPASKIMETVAGPLSETLPNLAKLASVGLIIPTSTPDCERGFSALKRIKTDIRNRMKDCTLNSLLQMAIEGPEVIKFPYTYHCSGQMGW